MNTEHARRMLDFQQIKQVPVTAVLERYGLLAQMKRVGAQLFSSCPIHHGSGKNKKQFVVNPAKNVWKCFGDCSRGGSTIELVSGIEGIEIRAAAELIASWFAIGTSQRVQHRKAKERAMSGSKPSHKVFAVEDKPEDADENDKAWWTRIGSAFPHKDGRGLNLVLQALPVNARIVLREYSEDDAKEDEAKKAKFKKK